MKLQRLNGYVLLAAGVLTACGSDAASGKGNGRDAGGPGEEDGGATPNISLPDVSKASFVAGVDNPYFPLPVGATWTYEANTPDGLERIEIEVLKETRTIKGVIATVVRDTVYLKDEIVEDTSDWYAQDSKGNVWYLGEDTCEFENGVCAVREGAWEWGVDGALPGIIMPASPEVDGQPYYQEYYVGEAQDVGEVIEVGLAAMVRAGSYDDCIKTRDTSTLDPTLREEKTYCRGVGAVIVDEPDSQVTLVQTSL